MATDIKGSGLCREEGCATCAVADIAAKTKQGQHLADYYFDPDEQRWVSKLEATLRDMLRECSWCGVTQICPFDGKCLACGGAL